MIEKAEKNNIPRRVYRQREKLGWSKERASTQKVEKRNYKGDFAVYVNGEMAEIGTIEECASKTGYSIAYLKWLLSPQGEKFVRNSKNPDKTTAVTKLDE